jgi:hypothetical protein
VAEVRTTSATGGQKGTKLARYDLIPQSPLKEVAEHFGVGALKYAGHQWRQGYEWSKSIAAKARHDAAFAAGEDYDVCSNDPEGCQHVDADGNEFVAPREDACYNHTGSHHLAASAWHALVLLEFKDRFPLFDDRYDPAADDEKYEAAFAPQPLGPEWQELGYIDGDKFGYFEEATDLRPFQDMMNASLRRLAEIAMVPSYLVEDEGRSVAVAWRDPEPVTLTGVAEALEKLQAVGFVGGTHEITDIRYAPEVAQQFGPDLLRKHAVREYARDHYAIPFKIPTPFLDFEFDIDLADWSVPAVDSVGEDD